jgi:hypothetical protein
VCDASVFKIGGGYISTHASLSDDRYIEIEIDRQMVKD